MLYSITLHHRLTFFARGKFFTGRQNVRNYVFNSAKARWSWRFTIWLTIWLINNWSLFYVHT